MAIVIQVLKVQLGPYECETPVYAAFDGVANTLGYTLFSDGVAVGAAHPLPVGGASVLTYGTHPSVSVSNTQSTTLIQPAAFTDFLSLQTIPGVAGNVYLTCDGTPATIGTGMCLIGGGASLTFGRGGFPFPTGPINAITDAGAPVNVMIAGA